MDSQTEAPKTKWLHLWCASNALLKSAPTISRHIGHKLAMEGKEHMTMSSSPLICKDCGTLTWTSSTRIRKRRRALRGRRNKVVSRCTECNAVTTQPGSLVVRKEKREKPAPVKRPKQTGKGHVQLCDNAVPKRTLRTLKSKERSSNKKKNSVSKARPSGLAASFLFQDVDE